MLRLQKFLAQSGLGSRRYCEKLIKDRKIQCLAGGVFPSSAPERVIKLDFVIIKESF